MADEAYPGWILFVFTRGGREVWDVRSTLSSFISADLFKLGQKVH